MVSEEKQITQTGKRPVRIKFCKTGALKYISHLDLNRTMQRIVVRSGIPVWYTEGFNPKPKLVFASPLSLGSESVCEYMDLKLVAQMAFTEIENRLNANMPDGLHVTDVYEPLTKFGQAAYAAYEISVKTALVTRGSAAQVETLFSQAPLILLKRTKSGEKETDIIPFIKHCTASYSDATGQLLLRAVLASDSEKYLNPEYLITALRTKLQLFSGDEMEENYSITRVEMYLSDGETPFH